ncbi:hypothetical protein JW926_17860, partial [Candidatus Sumerlaeota bacterium]|nr:hypothetical protein [Candidatus Sumerlaeota bacterium]
MTEKKKKKIRLVIDDHEIRFFPPGITVEEAIERSGIAYPYPVVGALLDGKVVELDRRIAYSGSMRALHLGTTDGMRLYQRSLSFVLVRAVRDVYPGLKVYINHSLSRGFYCELHAEGFRNIERFHLKKTDLAKIKKRMREIIDANEPFIRREFPLKDAIRLFQRLGQQDKVSLLKYRNGTGEKVSIYQCGREKNHFYGYLVPRTGCLESFDLKFYPPGFILLFP